MIDSDEEYVLDFKAEEKRAQLAVFEIEDIDSDCSTISASEVNSSGRNSPTPPLFYKLRKARVMIKKLPKEILKKYNLKSKNTAQSPALQPARSSKRVSGKKIPGQYLSLHVNKPLSVLANKKKRLKQHFIKTINTEIREEQNNYSQNRTPKIGQKFVGSLNKTLKSASISGKSYKNASKSTKKSNNTTKNSSLPSKKYLHQKSETTRQINVKHIAAGCPYLPNVNFTTQKPSIDRRSLHERIAATRIKNKDLHTNKPEPTTFTTYRDALIKKYLPSKNDANPSNPFVLNEPVNISSHVTPTDMGNSYIQNSMMTSSPKNNRNIQIPCQFGNTYSNFSHVQSNQSSNAFPTLITSADGRKQSLCQPTILNSSTTATNSGYRQPANSIPRIITVPTFTIPQSLSERNDPVVVNSPKVLAIEQPSLSSDPLDMSDSLTKNKIAPARQQVDKENNEYSDMESYAESETDVELSDTAKRAEPEVIKRIIYHTKSVQTKFTCNGSICGLIDSDEFNLNCFYCYDIFPLHKWLEFKEHVKTVHHVEEKENQSDSDGDINNSETPDCNSINARHEIGLSQYMKSSPKPINNKENCSKKAVNNTELISKKLPIDSRLAPHRINTADKAKLTHKTPTNNTKQLCQTQASNNLNRQHSSNSSCVGDIITLDSDDDVVETAKKAAVQQRKKATNNKSNPNNSVSLIEKGEKIILPSLPHITIKKVEKTLPKESTNNSQAALESNNLNESFIKIPSNLNIQKVIKTLPKPTAQQISTNGRTRPRYFVVKKIIKLPSAETIPDVNISKGMILSKMSEAKKNNNKNSRDDEDMPSNDEDEDSVPKLTNGHGILFGITNQMVVIEFLLKLKTFPELWRPQLKNNASNNCSESILKLCSHLNNRFELNITDFEMRLSIQRVKGWYCRMLKNIHEHNRNPNNTEPYKHKFLLYFKILNQFLTSDVKIANYLLPSSSLKSNANALRLDEKVQNVQQIKPKPPVTHFKATEPSTKPSATPLLGRTVDSSRTVTTTTTTSTPTLLTPTTTLDNSALTTEMTAESLIEFDPDTLYDNESSSEEVLETFDETKISNEKNDKMNWPKKRKTKIYVGSYECDLCRKVFKRRCDLKRHKVMHFPPEFECGVCSQKFYFQHWAAKCAHLKNKKYQRVEKNSEQDGILKPKRIWPKKIFRFKMICEICGVSYRSIGSLNTHRRDKHLNQREKCVVCSFTALSNWRIVQHQKKRHIVEFGTVEELAKKTRARTDTKTPFSNEARQEFLWRREMRSKLKPGEIFYGCSKCRTVFNSRKEKVLHNKFEHPVKETTVLCLMCLPNKLLLANSNCARRHYTDIHKVPWHEIDDLVKRTIPIFNLLTKEEIELVKASENYKELLEELLKDKKLEPIQKVEIQDDEALTAVQNLANIKDQDEEVIKVDAECKQEENVYIDGIIDHDYNNEEVLNDHEYSNNNEHNYSEEQEINETYDYYDEANIRTKNGLYSHHPNDDEIENLNYDTDSNDYKTQNSNNIVRDDQEYMKSNAEDFLEVELVEESIVVEECVDEE